MFRLLNSPSSGCFQNLLEATYTNVIWFGFGFYPRALARVWLCEEVQRSYSVMVPILYVSLSRSTALVICTYCLTLYLVLQYWVFT
jgi:hypothetical protein